MGSLSSNGFSQSSLPRAILFDHDGVLAASEPLHWSAWEQLLMEIGIPYNSAELRSCVGQSAPQILIQLLNRHMPGWDPSQFDLQALATRKNDFYLALAKSGLATYPGVLEGLQWLKQHAILTAVVSNSRRRELIAGLDLIKIKPFFDVIISRDEAEQPKPHPAPYALAVTTLGVDPLDCLAVEDSPTGMESALLAGVPVAAVLTNFHEATLEHPVAGRPDLKPLWIGPAPGDFFEWLKTGAR